jgi:hypothetical protein
MVESEIYGCAYLIGLDWDLILKILIELSMAKVIESNGTLTLQLSLLEKIFGLHKNIIVDKKCLISKKVAEKPWSTKVLKGVRAPGTAIPYVVLLGTMRYKGGKDFTAIYKKSPVTIYEFENTSYNRWIITE